MPPSFTFGSNLSKEGWLSTMAMSYLLNIGDEMRSSLTITVTLAVPPRWHPCNLFTLHQARISQNLTHREYALATETRYYNFCFHNIICLCERIRNYVYHSKPYPLPLSSLDLLMSHTGSILQVALLVELEHIFFHPLVSLHGREFPATIAGAYDFNKT